MVPVSLDMCTLALAYRPDADWPILLGVNRDESIARPSLTPGRHWSDRPHVRAGKDLEAGGTWLGLGDQGMVAGVLNRPESLGPAPDKRSRGELVLMALDHADAPTAAKALAQENAADYRPFNLVIADQCHAFWIRNLGMGTMVCWPFPLGISLITAHDRNDLGSGRIRTYLPRFHVAPLPKPGQGRWETWAALLACREFDDEADPASAMTIVGKGGFGTVSSALIALPSPHQKAAPVFQFANGRPDETPFEDVAI